MKILYLVDPQQDYLTSMIFEGLCTTLGNSNVFVYPMLKRWKSGDPDDDYTLPGGKTGWTGAVDYEPVRPDLPELSIDDICNNITTFDYIILASPREYVIKSFREIRNKLSVIPIPIILMDGEDGPNVQEFLIDEVQPSVIFKREVFYEAKYKDKKIYPLPFAAFQDEKPNFKQEKDINVFGIFGNTNPLRVRLVKKFHELNFGGNNIVDIDTRVSDWDRNKPRHGKMGYVDYMKNIDRSKIGLSCIGHGKDTVRYWEIPSYKTLMLVVNPKIVIPFPFKHKENAVFIREDMSNLEEEINYYLSHDKEREELAEAGYDHLMRFHTCEKRAAYMLSIIEGETR